MFLFKNLNKQIMTASEANKIDLNNETNLEKGSVLKSV